MRRRGRILLAALVCGALASCSGPIGSPGEGGGKVPDLVVTSRSVSDSGLEPGGRFTLSATVRNAGDGAEAATTLRYFRSADASITRSDTEVGTDEVAALAASRSGTESVDLTAPFHARDVLLRGVRGRGGWRVGHDGQLLDRRRGHGTNHRDQASGTAGPRGDHALGERQLSSRRERVHAFGHGANAGGAAGEATTLRYYRSTDAAITASDTEIGSEAVAELAAAGAAALGGSGGADHARDVLLRGVR